MKPTRTEILSADEHLREMENLRIEFRDKLTAEYMKGFWTGLIGFVSVVIVGVVIAALVLL